MTNNNFIPDSKKSSFGRLLTPDEVAELLSVSRSFAYKLLQTGEIPVVRLGKSRRVRLQDLETYIEQNIYYRVGNL